MPPAARGPPVKQHAVKGHTRKHAHATHKHAGHHAKHHPHHHHKTATAHGHHVHAKAKHAGHAKARGLALDGIACCGAEALAMSLRFQGFSVTGAEVLALHRAAGADDETGLPVLTLLEAAAESRLAGCRPYFEEVMSREPEPWCLRSSDDGLRRVTRAGQFADGILLGLELPGPHTVLATHEGWWSWGELYCPLCDFPDAVIEEAWAVQWAVAA